MLNAWGDSLSDLAHSSNGEDCAGEKEIEVDTQHVKLSKDDGCSSVTSIMSKTVQQFIKSVECKKMRIVELT
jgi:hypothetical protein